MTRTSCQKPARRRLQGSIGRAVTGIVLLLLASCNVDSGANPGMRCEVTSDCGRGRVCHRGFCVAGDGGASDATPDGARDSSAPDTGPPDAAPVDGSGDGPMCVAPEMLCDGSCVDTRTDDAHCGDCINRCDPAKDESCVNSRCCVDCGGAAVCVDIRSDPQNCGACGHDCSALMLDRCVNSVCCSTVLPPRCP